LLSGLRILTSIGRHEKRERASRLKNRDAREEFYVRTPS
jgi:hypothetical protein